jgi:SHS family lactate transporter-like MFS transporter
LFQPGYAVGYLLAALFFRALVPTTSHGWRSLFWFGSAPPVLLIAWRWYLPETNHFQVVKAEREAKLMATQSDGTGNVKAGGLRAFWGEFNDAFRKNWVLFIYLVVLMTGMNAIAHGSQDLYPTFLKDQVQMSDTQVSVITVVGQLGAILGSVTIGFCSTFTGRRLAFMTACLFGGAIVPAYIIPRDNSLIASTFFEQVFVGGVWGPIPVHLIELSPPHVRTLFYSFTYQLGNLASSASATIEAIIGERYTLPPGPGGEKRYNYGKVIGLCNVFHS